ncbi:ubiquitin family protein [Neobacillus dielmonensis]|uniref:methyltransferase n=1 Tax=Neobacillus dielmonensis TaxID=1347369 RepID=UPI0005A7325E|nr:methyltransferase [Neobacillus dielmonensis]
MHKLLVEIYNPASHDSYDVFIPVKSKVFEVAYLLSNTVSELSKGYFKATEQTVLCDRETGVVLDPNLTIEELGLKNGSKLMLL